MTALARMQSDPGGSVAPWAWLHTLKYLDLVGSCHGFGATLGRLVPRGRGQEFTEDEREDVRRQIGRVRAAADPSDESRFPARPGGLTSTGVVDPQQRGQAAPVALDLLTPFAIVFGTVAQPSVREVQSPPCPTLGLGSPR